MQRHWSIPLILKKVSPLTVDVFCENAAYFNKFDLESILSGSLQFRFRKIYLKAIHFTILSVSSIQPIFFFFTNTAFETYCLIAKLYLVIYSKVDKKNDFQKKRKIQNIRWQNLKNSLLIRVWLFFVSLQLKYASV